MKSIAIITGGASTEREISLRSAKNVENLLAGQYDVAMFDFPLDCERFLSLRNTFSVVIPLIHGKGGEDGTLQGFLETLGVPYVFSGVGAHAAALDKHQAKTLVASHGVTTPPAVVVRRGEVYRYRGPSVVKPLDGGSSVATAIVRTEDELESALCAGFEVSDNVLVEDFIGGQEFTVAVIDDERGARALPVIMIKPPQGFFDYQSKYNANALADEICPAPISSELTTILQNIAVRAHSALGCRHVSRTDIIVDDKGVAWFLEINTIPGMTETSLLPKACAADGIRFADVLTGWIETETTKRA